MAEASPKKKLLKMRTFAQDLTEAHKKTGEPLSSEILSLFPAPPKDVVTPTIKTTVTPIKDTPPIQQEKKISVPEQKKVPSPTITESSAREIATPKAPPPVRKVSVRAKKRSPEYIASFKENGPLITEKKSAKIGIKAGLLSSFNSWLKALTTPKPKKEPLTYTTRDTEMKKGVITKATSKTGSIFTADNETLKEQIRRRKLEEELHKVSPEPEITWTPNTEVGYALLEGRAILPPTSKVSVTFKKTAIPVEPVVPPPPVFVEPTVESVPPVPIAETAPVETTPPAIPPPVFVEPTVESVPYEVEIPTASPDTAPLEREMILTTPEAHARVRGLGAVARMNTNTLSLSVVGIIAASIIIILLLRALFMMLFTGDSNISTEPLEPLVSSAVAVDFVLPTVTREAALNIPSSSVGSPLTEFRFTDEENVPLSRETILSLLGFTNNGTLNTLIEDVRLGTVEGERVIIIKVSNPSAAFGSLLQWEDTMLDGIGPILGSPPISGTAGFTDQSIGNVDLRVYTAANQQVLVYGFIDESTVVFTRSVAGFSTVIGSQE